VTGVPPLLTREVDGLNVREAVVEEGPAFDTVTAKKASVPLIMEEGPVIVTERSAFAVTGSASADDAEDAEEAWQSAGQLQWFSSVSQVPFPQ
jgi:hypothetical protein